MRVLFRQVTVKTPITGLMEEAKLRAGFGGWNISGARFNETNGRSTSTFGMVLELGNKL